MLACCDEWLLRKRSAESVPRELLLARRSCLRDRGGDRKLSSQIQEQVKQWGRWELSSSARDADVVLVLSIEAKTADKIRLKNLEDPRRSRTKSMRFER